MAAYGNSPPPPASPPTSQHSKSIDRIASGGWLACLTLGSALYFLLLSVFHYIQVFHSRQHFQPNRPPVNKAFTVFIQNKRNMAAAPTTMTLPFIHSPRLHQKKNKKREGGIITIVPDMMKVRGNLQPTHVCVANDSLVGQAVIHLISRSAEGVGRLFMVVDCTVHTYINAFKNILV